MSNSKDERALEYVEKEMRWSKALFGKLPNAVTEEIRLVALDAYKQGCQDTHDPTLEQSLTHALNKANARAYQLRSEIDERQKELARLNNITKALELAEVKGR